ncbi:MAG: hypothetical protein IJS44_04185 [Clostridia bacterium]|nr:hypothetical protein [Clostridia bacterium]
MKKFAWALTICALALCMTAGALAAQTVYLDASGANGAYTTLPAAAEAVDNGGTIIVSGNTTTPTTAYTFPDKDLTITSEGGAVLTLGRVLIARGDLTFENITIANGTGANVDFIYANGHDLTIGEGVTTVANTSTKRYISLAAGINTGTCTGSGTVTVKSGTWRNVYGGNFQGTFGGSAEIVFAGGALSGGSMILGNVSTGANTATVTATVGGGSVTTIQGGSVPCAAYTVTLTGGSVNKLNLDATVAPGVGGSVTVKSGTGTVTTAAPEGYEIAEADGVYTLKEKANVDLTPRTVYLDGTGKTEGAYTSLSAALAEMPGGGTIILSGDTSISAGTALPETKEVLITSVYEDEDYRESAALKLYANLALGGDTIFRDVVIERAKPTSANIFISACGHALTMDEGVSCLNYTGFQWITLVGGNLSRAYTGDSHVTVKAGHFRNIFGGNYNGAFTGNSYVTVTGGVYDNAVCGGSFSGDFTGDAHLTFGGEAVILYATSAPQGLVGGTLGENGGTAHTFTGDIYLALEDNCAITGVVVGGSRNNNITTKGNTYVTVNDNAYAYFSLYGASYSGVFDGDSSIIINSGDIQGNICGGGYNATVTGSTRIEIKGGTVCQHSTNSYSSGSSPAGTKNVFGANESGGSVGKNTEILLSGGRVYGDICGEAADRAITVGGTSSVTLTNGVIFGKVYGADSAAVDLSAGGTVSIGVASSVDTLVGGGKLILAAGAPLTVGEIRGAVQFEINGLPLPLDYITATTLADGASVVYAVQGEETLVKSGSVYSIDFPGACKTVNVTVTFKEGAECRMRLGGASSGAWLTPDASTATSATYALTPGLYSATVLFSSTNYCRKAIYVYGNAETQTVSVEYDPATGEGYECIATARHTDEINATRYNNEDVEGFYIPDTPYFRYHNGTSVFTSNAEMNAYLEELAARCDYMYLFYQGVSESGFTCPVVVFTKDEIPEGASLAEIAKIVGSGGTRDILLYGSQVHGNEQSCTESALMFATEMCGEYGESVFDGTNIGAVIQMPRLGLEGSYTNSRENQNGVLNPNPNRDYMLLSNTEIRTYAYVYHLFMPTLTLDMHEAMVYPVWSAGELLTDTYDFSLSYFSPISGMLSDTAAVLAGDLSAATRDGDRGFEYVRAKMDACGLRTYYYRKDRGPMFGQNYAANLGAYAYVFEVPGLGGGDEHYARRVFAGMQGMKELLAYALSEDGKIAARVTAARTSFAEKAQIHNDRDAIVLEQTRSRVPTYAYRWNNPLVGADGTIRYAVNPTMEYNYDVAVRYRTRATAYVIPADLKEIDTILEKLEQQFIQYTYLDKGTTITLQQYGGTTSAATVGEPAEVTFANGAYLIPVDGYRAEVISFLFEPDCNDCYQGYASFALAGYMEVDQLYRTTENFIAAKLGLDGTYIAVAVPEGKTVARASVDGKVYENVAVEDGNAFVLAADQENYSVTLDFTDDTSTTTNIGSTPGDIDGDNAVTVRDALLAIRALVNGERVKNADMNGDGKFSLADIIRLLKTVAK